MSWINRLRATFRKNKLESHLNDEIQFHIEMRTKEFVAAGMAPEDARSCAARQFGNQILLKERTRDMDTIGWIETFRKDSRYAARMFGTDPGFTAVVVVTLALGIGANTAIFSLTNTFVLHPLRAKNPEQLVLITERPVKERGRRSPTEAAYFEWKKHSLTLQDIALAGFNGDPTTLSGIGHAERVNGGYCGINYFSLLGVKPFRGRFFLPEDGGPGESKAAVISEALWQPVRHFGFGSNPFPIMYGSYHQHGSDYPGGLYTYHVWKSVTIKTARDPMSLVSPLQKVVAQIDKDQALFEVQTIEKGLSESLAFPRFQMNLFGIFGGLALLLSAVGIYGVMSYVVTQRSHEIGVRVALGANYRDVLRLVLTRGLTTTVTGLVIGIAASLALTRLIAGELFGVKNSDPVTYCVVASVLTTVALIACYIPAHRAARVDPSVALKHE